VAPLYMVKALILRQAPYNWEAGFSR